MYSRFRPVFDNSDTKWIENLVAQFQSVYEHAATQTPELFISPHFEGDKKIKKLNQIKNLGYISQDNDGIITINANPKAKMTTYFLENAKKIGLPDRFKRGEPGPPLICL